MPRSAPSGRTTPPLDNDAFAAAMVPLGPFEHAPHLAVAVSGGADSLALALLAEPWARARGGRVTALTVDHGLRPEAGDEARRVGVWLAARGIAHQILLWRRPTTGPGAGGSPQAAARAGRYAVLAEWCRAACCLHLLVAHHREDQAETFLLRLARGSGLDGLAAMPAIRELGPCRLLRPLLGVERARLAAVLREAGQDWVDDPSNRNRAFARIRLREAAGTLAEAGLTTTRLAATAEHIARARTALERATAAILAQAVTLHPAGFALLDHAALADSAAEVRLRALARLVTTISGSQHTPRLARLERLAQALLDGLPKARTLSGCRLSPWRGRILVSRETVQAAPAVPAAPGGVTRWDGRFRLDLAADAPAGLSLGALGNAGRQDPALVAALARIPGAARPTLPALFDAAGVVAVPHIHYARSGAAGLVRAILLLSFRPNVGLTAPGFTVV